MLGGIYSTERCLICGSQLTDNHKDAVTCNNHPQVQAKRIRVQFRGIWKRFTDYQQAQKYLYGLRFKTDEGSFDPRDYMIKNPLAFDLLVETFLEEKRHHKAVKDMRNRLNKALDVWGDRSIKTITGLDITKLANTLLDKYASYYVKVIISQIETLFNWCFDNAILRQGIDAKPKFPVIQYEMGLRDITDADTQTTILEIIDADNKDNPRIHLAINMLRTYLHVRPMELMGCDEKHLKLGEGILIVPTSKEGKVKLIKLLEEDIEVFKALPKAIGNSPLFRYDKGTGGQKPGRRFGHHVLYNAWRRACEKVGLSGVSVYPGTRHTTASHLGTEYSPEQVKRATGHNTGKAFARYFTMPSPIVKSMYEGIRGGKKGAKVLPFPPLKKVKENQ